MSTVCKMQWQNARSPTLAQPSPTRKHTNISTKNIVALRDAPANSCHTKTPQHADTIVAPCPML